MSTQNTPTPTPSHTHSHTHTHTTTELISHSQNVLKYLEIKKKSKLDKRCEQCWHDPRNCICAALPPVHLNANINLVVYMDSKEMYNAGDDAKLLHIVCPNQTKQFIYAGEDDQLVEYIRTKKSDSVVVLFPSDKAISFWEFIDFRSASQRQQGVTTDATGGDLNNFSSEMTIIAVDAVWRHARRMAKRLRELLPDVRHVQLTPEQMSVYARTQTQSDRICTVEATALFLSHLGESKAATNGLVECVRINNAALRPRAKNCTFDRSNCKIDPKSSGTNLYFKQENATHPCWYFGSNYFVPPSEKAKLAKEKQQQSQRKKAKVDSNPDELEL
jgi:DTW domain-containing protein YfiP